MAFPAVGLREKENLGYIKEEGRSVKRRLTRRSVLRRDLLLEDSELRLQTGADEISLHLALVVPRPADEPALGLDELLEDVLDAHEPDEMVILFQRAALLERVGALRELRTISYSRRCFAPRY